MFIIMEVQVFVDGDMSIPCYTFNTKNSAEQKYYTVLSSVAVSKLPIHTAFILAEDGYVIKLERFKHEIKAEIVNE